jgi:hypothetical protein
MLFRYKTNVDNLPMLTAEGKISVTYMGHWSFLQWSEVAARGEVFAGSSWRPSWPAGVSEATISRILNLTMPGTQGLVRGGLFAVDYLELQLVSALRYHENYK